MIRFFLPLKTEELLSTFTICSWISVQPRLRHILLPYCSSSLILLSNVYMELSKLIICYGAWISSIQGYLVSLLAENIVPK